MQYAWASLGTAGALQVVLGEAGAQIAAADHELLGALAGLAVLRVVTATVGTASHRERVLPARHVRAQVSLSGGQLALEPL